MTAKIQEDGAALSMDEARLYDRQLRLWGLEAQQRMRKSRLLLIGVNGLANEVAKNLVLAGIGKLTLADGEPVKAQDLGAQFFLRESDVGKNRAVAALDRVAALNPGVSVNAVELVDFKVKKDIELSLLDEVDMVILCEGGDLTTITNLNAHCRSRGIKFLSASTQGYLGYIFTDPVTFTSVAQPDTESKPLHFPTFSQALKKRWSAQSLQKSPRDLKRFRKRASHVYFLFGALWQFVKRYEEMPSSKSIADMTKLKNEWMTSVECDPSFVTDEELRSLCNTAGTELAPVCAILGGFLAQEILKQLAGKEPPLNNFFCYDAFAAHGQIISVE